MIKVENIEVFNFDGAIRGMRNPLNSHHLSDTAPVEGTQVPIIGPKDLDLMRRLYKGGSEHRKYLRQIFVSMDITAPTYLLAELDTYKIGVTRNSCSFMHKGTSKPFTIEDFSTHNENSEDTDTNIMWEEVVEHLNKLRDKYLETKDDAIFQQIRCLLPSGYNQTATFTMNYENVVNIIKQRSNHRLKEWHDFIKIFKDLPYIKEIMEE